MDDEKRVLIIDDDILIRRALADYLNECGFTASTAPDGAQGLALAQSGAYDVVLVDLRMPQMDGLEVIATLKEQRPQMPLVVVSGTGVLSDAIAAIRQGASDYITKPIQDMDQVVVVIERVIKIARLTAERDRYQQKLEELNRSLEAEVKRQTRDLRIQNRELTALNRVSYAISAPLDLDTMLNRAIDAATTALETDGGVVRLFNEATNQLVVAVARGLPESYLSSARAIPLGQGLIGRVAQSGRPEGGSNLADDPWLAPLVSSSSQAGKDGACSLLCVPLRTGDEIVGTLGVLRWAAREFDPREIELLATIGNQIGVAVARTQYADKLQQNNLKLERAVAELRRLDTLREQFIQNVAHELRTPLALAHGYIEMLAQGGLSSDEQQMALNVACRRVQALVDLVGSITTLQDLDSQSLRVEKISPTELIQTAVRMSWQRALGVNIELRDTCPPDLPLIHGDFTRLAQALHQLLDNACKFSPQKSTVTISAQVESDALLISVADQGIGIPAEEHEHIFDRFYQIDGSATRRYGGTGMGLAIAKEIVEAHGGHVTLKSVVKKGSVFTMWLPRQG